jgi:hypothetical protein
MWVSRNVAESYPHFHSLGIKGSQLYFCDLRSQTFARGGPGLAFWVRFGFVKHSTLVIGFIVSKVVCRHILRWFPDEE